MPGPSRRYAILMLLAILLVLAGGWRRLSEPQAPDIVGAASALPEADTRAPLPPVDDRDEAVPTGIVSTDCSDTYEKQIDDFFRAVSEEDAGRVLDIALRNAENDASSDHIVIASHIVDSPEERVALLRDGIEANPGSAHLHWTAVNACVMANDSATCPELDQWIERLLALDGENALAWALAGHAYLNLDRQYEALDAFRRGSISYSANNYHGADVEAAMTAVNALGGYSDVLAYAVSVGHTAAFAKPLSHFNVCKEKSVSSPEWADVCLALGQTIESTATDFMSRAYARRTQWQSRIAKGEDPETPALRALNEANVPLGLDKEALRYPDSPRLFVEALRNSGEIRAYEMLMAMHQGRMAEGYTVDCGDIRY
ncbi:MAG: hypothetical protein AAGA33_06825 [Pseudomonadota bacterium]